MKKEIFLDYASSTPVDTEVQSAMNEYNTRCFANPSALYSSALFAKEIMTDSLNTIAQSVGCSREEIVVTSGGTESNNLALLGAFEYAVQNTEIKKPHIIVSSIEHPAILEVCNEIERRGGEITVIPVGEDGIVSARAVRDAITSETVLVSIMYANNEIGTIQPISEIGREIKMWRRENDTVYPYFHSDACQAVLYCPMSVVKLGVDMMTVDGLKMYGPHSTGMLYIKRGTHIAPIMFGGGQQRGLRSGTENVASVIGLAKAFEIADRMRESESERLSHIRDYAITQIETNFPNATLNGSRDSRLPNNVNFCFPGMDAEFAVISLDVMGISVSYSSSCRTLKEDSTSYVIEALGMDKCQSSSLRFTFGRETTQEDVDGLVQGLIGIIK